MCPSGAIGSEQPLGEARHWAMLHDGAADLALRAAPELGAALDRGEAVYASLTTEEWEALEAALGPASAAITQLPAPERYVNPGTAMAALHSFIDESLAAGASAVWSIGSVPIADDLERDVRWARYESAADHVLAGVPFRGICAYDRSKVSAPVVDMMRRCHTMVDDPQHGLHPCHDHQPYAHSSVAWAHRDITPHLELWDVEPAKLREALAQISGHVLDDERVADLQLVATELVTNSTRHGAHPVVTQAWVNDEGVVLEVWDHGPGIPHPYADLLPHRGGVAGGHGLWLVGQLSDQVSIGREDRRTVVVASLSACA